MKLVVRRIYNPTICVRNKKPASPAGFFVENIKAISKLSFERGKGVKSIYLRRQIRTFSEGKIMESAQGKGVAPGALSVSCLLLETVRIVEIICQTWQLGYCRRRTQSEPMRSTVLWCNCLEVGIHNTVSAPSAPGHL